MPFLVSHFFLFCTPSRREPIGTDWQHPCPLYCINMGLALLRARKGVYRFKLPQVSLLVGRHGGRRRSREIISTANQKFLAKLNTGASRGLHCRSCVSIHHTYSNGTWQSSDGVHLCGSQPSYGLYSRVGSLIAQRAYEWPRLSGSMTGLRSRRFVVAFQAVFSTGDGGYVCRAHLRPLFLDSIVTLQRNSLPISSRRIPHIILLGTRRPHFFYKVFHLNKMQPYS